MHANTSSRLCARRCRARDMTLKEISADYRAAARPIRARLREIRQARSRATDRETVFRLERRKQALSVMLTQLNELAELTARYYERGYYRNEKYRL